VRAATAGRRGRAVRAGLVALVGIAVFGIDLGTLASRGDQPAQRSITIRLVNRDLGALTNPAATIARADQARTAAVTALLVRRGAAVMTHNEGAFLADVDPSDPSFFASQQALFHSLEAVPFSSVQFVADAASATGRPHPARYGTAGTWTPDVRMQYRLAGFDPTNATERQVDTFVRRGSRWLLASNSDLAALGHPSDHELWDYGQVVVVHGVSSLVLGFASDEPLMRTLAAEADRDIPRVSAVWGSNWARRAVLEVPATQQQFAAVSGAGGDLSQVEAVQSTEVSGDGRQQSGNRITVNPAPFSQLSPAGRGVVLTHELTHVATRAVTMPITPLWLVEGLADYTGFLQSGLSNRSITLELRALVRASGAPTALPANSAFGSGDPNVAASYEEGWLACRLIATRYGSAQLVRFYTLVGTSTGTSTAAVDSSLRAVTGQGLTAFTAQWRSYVTAQVR
jgi:hypothetical protein